MLSVRTPSGWPSPPMGPAIHFHLPTTRMWRLMPVAGSSWPARTGMSASSMMVKAPAALSHGVFQAQNPRVPFTLRATFQVFEDPLPVLLDERTGLAITPDLWAVARAIAWSVLNSPKRGARNWVMEDSGYGAGGG